MRLPAPAPDIYDILAACRREGRPAALAIIVEAVGSTPQKTGAKLMVRDDGLTVGTVGGGEMELRVIEAAREVIRAGTPRLLTLELTEAQGYLCGGRLQVYLEPITPLPALIIVGAGHVGLAVAALAEFTGFQVTLVDDREITLPESLAHAGLVQIQEYSRPFQALTITNRSVVLIATRGHRHDQEALAAALHTPAGYIGLLGSARKRASLARALMELGFSWEELRRVRCPVGLALGAVSPEEIAVSIVAQLISHRRNHAPNDFGPPAGRRLVDPDGST